MHRLRLVAALTVISAASVAHADGWPRAFPPAALETHLPGAGLEIMVGASARPGSAAAADALREALLACPGVRRAAIATTPAGVDDDASRIAWLSRRAGGGFVFFVRVERDGEGIPGAVVSLFDGEGRPSGAFVASPEEPLRRKHGATPAEGLPRAAVSSVDAVLAGPAAPRGAETIALPTPRVVIPRDAAGRLQLDDAYAQYPSTNGAPAYREPLPGEQLYQALDRPDLVDAYASRRRARYALITTGGVLVGLGLLAAGSTTIAGGIAYAASGSDHDRATLTGGGIALGVAVGAGVAFIVGGKLMSRHPIGASRVARIAESRRRALEARAGAGGGAP